MLPLRGANDRPPIWVFDPHPGSVHFVIIVGPDEFDAIVEQGHATLDGVRAFPVHEHCVRELGWMRFLLERPYQLPSNEVSSSTPALR